jgi:uncharacterized protein (TIGR02598 family)
VKRCSSASNSFSLVEVTVALGVTAFCLVAVFGLLPVGLKANQNSISQTAAASILSAVIADMRATPKSASSSVQFGITFGTETTLYFDNEGKPSSSLGPNSRYQLKIRFPSNGSGTTAAATFADLKVTWPAAAAPENALGSSEVFAAFDRR